MSRIIFVLFVILQLIGCATVVDRDFEKEEADFIRLNGVKATDPFWSPPTPEHVTAYKEDDVRITLHKMLSTKVENLNLQNWNAVLANDNDEPKCVMSLWKLMDFQMDTNYPDFVYIAPHQVLADYAHLRQTIWSLDGTKFALPPSGYVERMIVKDPREDVKHGQECVFEDENVEEK